MNDEPESETRLDEIVISATSAQETRLPDSDDDRRLPRPIMIHWRRNRTLISGNVLPFAFKRTPFIGLSLSPQCSLRLE